MSKTENLDHSLTIIQDLGVKTDDALEKKREEIKISIGGVAAMTELVKVHSEFMEKNKQELEASVKEGKLASEFVKASMSISSKSHDVIKKFLTDKTAQYNVKRGEANALESSVKLLKTTHDVLNSNKRMIEEAKKAELEAKKAENELLEKQREEQSQQVRFEEISEVPKKAVGRKKRRPDEAAHVSETVNRLKESRRKKANK
jgi:hypothetical protein